MAGHKAMIAENRRKALLKLRHSGRTDEPISRGSRTMNGRARS